MEPTQGFIVTSKNSSDTTNRIQSSTELTEENVKYFNEATIDGVRFGDSSYTLHDGESVKLDETTRNIIIDETRANRLMKDRLPITSNDRDIPKFLQDDIEEVLGISHFDRTSGFRSKGVQTRISGVRTISNFFHTNDLSHPAMIMNSSVRLKDPSSCISYSSELTLTRSHLYNVHCNYQKLKSRFHKLHEDYYKLIRVAGELTIALENSARGNPVDLPGTLKSCIHIYPDVFNHNVRDDNTEIKSIKSEVELQHHDLTKSRQPILGIVPVSSKHFDFKKIKLHLIGGNIKTKLLLLQALRWKITLSQPAERDEAIHEYTSSDLLGIHGQLASDSGKSILPYLLIPLDVVLPHPVQQSAARLLNTLASLRCGRDYLSVGPTVLNVVVQCLDTARVETVDAFTCDMLLAMLQKMSLRRQQRLYMIGMGLVEWLIYHLRAEIEKIGTYRLEYATALLMNLSLHREAQVRASTMTTLILSTLTELLSSSHLPALPYVNGSLNNFLANRTINEEAKKMGLDDVLEYHRKRNTGEIRRHLDHILNRHRRNSNESIGENKFVADDDSEELDILENELDELDPVKIHAGELFGEALLATCYSISLNENGISGHENDNNVSSPRAFKLDLSESEKHQSRKVSKEDYVTSSREKLISPDMNAPRFTPSCRKLTSKNTIPLKVIELPERFLVKISDQFSPMMDRSVEAFDSHENSSESEIEFLTEDTPTLRSTNASSAHSRANGSFNVGTGVKAANSTTTLISVYDSAAEVEDRMSSIASLPVEIGTKHFSDQSKSKESIDNEVDEDAFLSKPLIMRTPPSSAVMRALNFREEEDDDDVVERDRVSKSNNVCL